MNTLELKKALETALEAVDKADEINESYKNPYSVLRNKLITIKLQLEEAITFTEAPVFTFEELL
jgi:hypothetical protein